MPAFTDYPQARQLLAACRSANRPLIEAYDAFLQSQGKAEKYRSVSIRVPLLFDHYLQGRPMASRSRDGPTVSHVSEADVVRFLNSPTKRGQVRKGQGRSTYAIRIKAFAKWLNGGEQFPDCVKRIKTSLPKKEELQLRKGDLWTQADVKRLIECCDDVRGKALLSTLYDLAAAPEEVLGLQVGDIVLHDKYGTSWRLPP